MTKYGKPALGVTAAAIVASIIAVEGGFTVDHAGETNHGVTVQVARDYGYVGSMKDLPKEYAQEIYYNEYIVKTGFLPLVQIQPAVAHKVIDAGVNTGPSRPSKWLQSSLNSFSRGGKDYPLVVADGKVGSATINAYLGLEKARGKVKACELMLKALDGYQVTFYMSLTQHNQYTVGWVDNRVGNVPLTKCKDYGVSNVKITE